jgi:hypothetical protein
LEKQEIWRYEDPPILYDDYLISRYPFRYPSIREIERGNYEARYRIKDTSSPAGSFGKERAVVYADMVDTKEEAENRLDYEGGSFFYADYDVSTYHDRAIVTLQNDTDGDLYTASIYGRPIVLDLNRSCFMRDDEAITQYGTIALNVTGSYFSEDTINGRPQYEDWAARELAERENIVTAPSMAHREFTVKTHRGIFHARVGAKVKIQTKTETLKGTINALSLRYKKGAAFEAVFKITEQ